MTAAAAASWLARATGLILAAAAGVEVALGGADEAKADAGVTEAAALLALLLDGKLRTSSPEGVMSKSEGKMEGWSWTCLFNSLNES